MKTITRRCFVPEAVMLLLALLQSGCIIKDKQLNDAIAVFDRGIDILENTKTSIEQRLIEVGKVLNNRVSDLSKTLREIGEEVSLIPHTTIDYARSVLRAEGGTLLTALKKERARLVIEKQQGCKNPESVIAAAFANLAKARVFLEPYISTVPHDAVEIAWDDPTRSQCKVTVRELQIRGWGFLRPASENDRISVGLWNKDKTKEIARLPWHPSGNFAMTVVLDATPQQWLDAYWVIIKDKAHPDEPGHGMYVSHKVPEPPAPSFCELIKVDYQISERKHEHYGLELSLKNLRTGKECGVIRFLDVQERSAALIGTGRLIEFKPTDKTIEPGDEIVVTLTSIHFTSSTQFCGRWGGSFSMRFDFSNGNHSKDYCVTSTSTFLQYDHRGGIFAPNDEKCSRSFRITVPRHP